MRFTYETGAQPLPGYTIQRGIHRGGFGEVYFAHSDGGKEVALKLLDPRDHDIEVRGVTQCLNLKHPNLINLYDVRTDGRGDHWVVMEYVAGSSLEDVLASFRDGLPLAEVRDWLVGLVAGVSHLHERGIVHRDLKPANVYRENGVVKIGDVGLSKRLDSNGRRQHTQSVGTVYYMAPEVAHGQYGPEVDVYSLGIMLYEMLTGKLPFTGETTAEILMKHLTAPPDLSLIPKSLRPAIARALEKDPRKRTPSVRQLEQDFLRAVNRPAAEQIPESAFASWPTSRPAAQSVSHPGTKPIGGPIETQMHPAVAARRQGRLLEHRFWQNALIVLILLAVFLPHPHLGWRRFHPVALVVIGVIVFQSLRKRRRMVARAPLPTSQPSIPPSARPAATPSQPVAQTSSPRPPVETPDERMSRLGSSLGAAAIIATILSTGVWYALENLQRYPIMPSVEHLALFTAISVLGSWIVLGHGALAAGFRWNRQQRWLGRLAAGAALGTVAYGLEQFLLIQFPHVAYTSRGAFSSLGKHPLAMSAFDPTWLGFVVFFVGCLGIRRWNRETDPRAPRPINLWLTASAMVVGYVLSTVFAFPQWYAMLWAGTISATAQLASHWSLPTHVEQGT